MRLAAILVCVFISSPAMAQQTVWGGKEGPCSEWTSEWTMAPAGPNMFSGTVKLSLTGGPCAPRADATLTGNVSAMLSGTEFAAQQSGMANNNNCNYRGATSSGLAGSVKVWGTYVCSISPGPYAFELYITK